MEVGCRDNVKSKASRMLWSLLEATKHAEWEIWLPAFVVAKYSTVT